MGELLRRYWWPIAVAEHLGPGPQLVKLLGEEFVLFRTKQGELGLLDKHCCHRNASLEYGRVEENGLRCCYHGWLYDTQGKCLDQPCEPVFSDFKNKVRQGAYAVREVSGFIFAYIGPKPVPEFPRYDILFEPNCNKVVQGRDIHGNWLQRVDNMLDSLHVMALHASVYPELAMVRRERQVSVDSMQAVGAPSPDLLKNVLGQLDSTRQWAPIAKEGAVGNRLLAPRSRTRRSPARRHS